MHEREEVLREFEVEAQELYQKSKHYQSHGNHELAEQYKRQATMLDMTIRRVRTRLEMAMGK